MNGHPEKLIWNALQSHAERIAEHALAMKAVDPTMKVFCNDNNQSPSRLKDFLATAGYAVDGAEFHGKGPSIYASLVYSNDLYNYSHIKQIIVSRDGANSGFW